MANIPLYFLQACQKMRNSKKMCNVYTPALEIVPWPPQLTTLAFILQDPLFLEQKQQEVLSVLHLSGNSAQEFSTFAHAITTAWDPSSLLYSSPHHAYPSSSAFSLDLSCSRQTASSLRSRLGIPGSCVFMSLSEAYILLSWLVCFSVSPWAACPTLLWRTVYYSPAFACRDSSEMKK